MGPIESHEKKVFRKNPNMGLQAILRPNIIETRNQKTNLESLDSAGLLWLCLSFLSAQHPRLGRHFATLSLLFSKSTIPKKVSLYLLTTLTF